MKYVYYDIDSLNSQPFQTVSAIKYVDTLINQTVIQLTDLAFVKKRIGDFAMIIREKLTGDQNICQLIISNKVAANENILPPYRMHINVN